MCPDLCQAACIQLRPVTDGLSEEVPDFSLLLIRKCNEDVVMSSPAASPVRRTLLEYPQPSWFSR